MPVEVSMVITMMLSNNRGISLVVLIVAMTLIALLGASFVSLMGSKQKGFLYQINSYRALNIANAGVEYAIRYASDGLDGSSNSIFFSDPTLATIGKSFNGGIFSVVYTYDPIITTDYITVTGTYSNSSRQIKLTSFRRYISPITLVPSASNRPYRSGNDAIVPVISNNENNFTVNRIDVTVPATGGNTYLDIWQGGVSIFDYAASAYPSCTPLAPICKDLTNGIYIAGSGTIQFDISSPPLASNTPPYTYTLRFSATAPAGFYMLKFYTSVLVGTPFTVQFTLP
jgi:hypothetical protein